MRDWILLWVNASVGCVAVVVIAALLGLWWFGGIRLAVAGLLRLIGRTANRFSSWLVKGAIGDE